MNKFTYITVYTTLIFAIEFVMTKYGSFAFIGTILLFAFFGFITRVMGHKKLSTSAFLATIIFTLVLIFFGWTFMQGWLKPEDYLRSRK